jgi:cardiolipin synthase A/B
MTVGFDQQIALAIRPRQQDQDGQQHLHQGEAGTSTGTNIAPGSNDDGWIVPPPIQLSDGTRVQLYKDGEALHAAYRAIESAQRRICLEVYIFAADDTGWAFTNLLCRKARMGIKVYVIYDDFGSFKSRRLIDKMRRAGVRLQAFHPVRPWECNFSWRPALRHHRKLLVIDDHIGGLGGLNIGAEYAGSWVVRSSSAEVWRDNAIGMIGPSVRSLLQAFARSWYYVTHGGRIGRAELIHNLAGDEHPTDFGLLASVPTRSSPLQPFLRQLFRSARRSIQLTISYFAPSDDLIDELCAASRRGVKVQLMLPAISDLQILVHAARAFYEKLLANGVEIYERQAAVLHSKTMTIDQETSIVGSANLDHRSIEYNTEISAIIRSQQFGKQMDELFRHDIRFSKPITQDQWRHRPMWDRFAQWAVMRARYLL